MEVVWSDDALADVQEIFIYIASDSARYADEITARFFASAERLKSFPRSGRMVPEFEQENFRELIVGDYRILYEVLEDSVRVVNVLNGSRQLRGIEE